MILEGEESDTTTSPFCKCNFHIDFLGCCSKVARENVNKENN